MVGIHEPLLGYGGYVWNVSNSHGKNGVKPNTNGRNANACEDV